MTFISTPPRLSFVFDFDSTLVRVESLEELIAISLHGQKDSADMAAMLREIQRITNAGMNGELDLRTSIDLRLKAVPIHQHEIDELALRITDDITPGISQVIHDIQTHGSPVYVLSGGLRACILPVSRLLGISDEHIFANDPLFDDTGRVIGCAEGPLLEDNGKTLCLRNMQKQGLLPGKTVMTGDGISDLVPYREGVVQDFLGFGIHRRRAIVEQEAPHFFTDIHSFHAHILSLLIP